MRSRASRLIIGAIAWILFGAGAFLLLDIEQQAAARRLASQSFDARAHDVTAALADVRVAQQAYVADGQDVAVWKPRVDTLVAAATRGIERLAASTTSPGARAALAEARVEMTRLESVDEEARVHLGAGRRTMAGELVLTEGGRTAVAAARLVDRARNDEREEAALAAEAARRQQGFTLLAAAIVGAFVILLLALSPAPGPEIRPAGGDTNEGRHGTGADVGAERDGAPAHHEVVAHASPPPEIGTSPFEPLLAEASAICTALGRAAEPRELAAALERAAALMRASGLIVWIGDAAEGPLEPAFAHGYSPQALARMPLITRAADNAVACAYRTGVLQIVPARANERSSAIVAPLVSPKGCIGAFTAELAAGEETTLGAHALAALFAAQFASLLGRPSAVAPTAGPGDAAASA
jgi:CHASE3 domain sensor protein